MFKKLAVILAFALLIVTIGCGSDSKPTSSVLSYVARAQSDDIPHLFTLNVATQTSTAVNIPIPSDAYYISANSDATAVTYCRNGDSGYDIFLMGTDGQEKELTTAADACESVFSPDGKTIAFISGQSGDLQVFTMSADGSNQAALYAPPTGMLDQFYPEFSPDGKSVVFYIALNSSSAAAQHRPNVGRAPAWPAKKNIHPKGTVRTSITPIAPPSQDGWYTMALTDTDPTLAFATESWWGPAVFSVDGTKLLLTIYDGVQDNIARVNLDGSDLTPLTTGTDTYSFSPVPYQTVILFNRYNGDTSSWDIYAMDQSGGNQVLVHSTASTWETLLDSYWSGD